MKDILRLQISIPLDLQKKMFEILKYGKHHDINERFLIKNNRGRYLIIFKKDILSEHISLNINDITTTGKSINILSKEMIEEKELFSVIYKQSRNLDVYFRINISDITELEQASTYVLDRLDYNNTYFDLVYLLKHSDFNIEFELVEYCVIVLFNIDLLNNVMRDTIKEKLDYFGYNNEYLPDDIYLAVKEFINSEKLNWYKISSKEFADKILKLLLIELYHKELSIRFLLKEIKHYLSAMYGMYIYRRYYEHKGEL